MTFIRFERYDRTGAIWVDPGKVTLVEEYTDNSATVHLSGNVWFTVEGAAPFVVERLEGVRR